MSSDKDDKALVDALTYRVPLHDPRLPFIILWSQKSACTTVVKWVFAQLGLLNEALAHHPWVHNYENEVFKARRGYMKECVGAIQSGKPVIKFVRNPYARAYSGYLETCGAHVLKPEPHWSKNVRVRVLRGLTGSDRLPELAYSFNQFARWLSMQPLFALDPHLSPQYQDVEDGFDVRVVQVEEGREAFVRLEQEFGLAGQSENDRIFQSGHHHAKTAVPHETAVAAFDLAIPVQRRRDFQVFDAGPGAIARSEAGSHVRRLFARDFQRYGYAEFPA